MLTQLGGASMMRGFVQDKYRDKHYAAFQTEYRFPMFWRIGGAVFGSVGDVSSKISNFNLSDLKKAGGIGLRVNIEKKQHINLRIDIAHNSDKETNLYINLLEAF